MYHGFADRSTILRILVSGFISGLVSGLVWGGGSIAAQDLVVLEETGPRTERINIVVVAEGYTATQLEDFPGHAQALIDHLLSEQPFLRYAPYFNAYALKVASAESGADEPDRDPPVSVDTAFDATYNSFGIPRLLTVSTSKVLSALLSAAPDYDIGLVLVNATRYGGSGGTFAVTSRASSAAEIAAHEIGHSFAGLADEYESAGGIPREAPNATMETNANLVLWNDWFEEGTPIPTPENFSYESVVGLFEGAVYTPRDWYRPHFNAKMRSLGRPWGQVNREQIVKSIYSLVEPFWSSSPEDDQVLSGAQDVELAIDRLMQPVGLPLNVRWRMNNVVIPDETATQFRFPLGRLGNGTHTVTAAVADATPFVRTDPDGLLAAVETWHFTVTGFTHFDAWIEEAFPAGSGDSGGMRGDPDGDGWTNLLEYGLGGDPGMVDGGDGLSVATLDEGQLFLQFTRDPTRSDIAMTVEMSTEFEEWKALARSEYGDTFSGDIPVVEAMLDDGRIFCRIMVSDTTESEKMFMRIKVQSLEQSVEE